MEELPTADLIGGHDHPNYREELGHLKRDTIVGHQHKSAVVTLAERISKCIIAIKPDGRKASDIETPLNQWLNPLLLNLFKSINNNQDIDIYFADPWQAVPKRLERTFQLPSQKERITKGNGFQSCVTGFYLRGCNEKKQHSKEVPELPNTHNFMDHVGESFDKSMLSRFDKAINQNKNLLKSTAGNIKSKELFRL